jgi:hypothetical protein
MMAHVAERRSGRRILVTIAGLVVATAGCTGSLPTPTPESLSMLCPSTIPGLNPAFRWALISSSSEPILSSQAAQVNAFVRKYNQQCLGSLEAEWLTPSSLHGALTAEVTGGAGPVFIGPIDASVLRTLSDLLSDLDPQLDAWAVRSFYKTDDLSAGQIGGKQLGLPYTTDETQATRAAQMRFFAVLTSSQGPHQTMRPMLLTMFDPDLRAAFGGSWVYTQSPPPPIH